MSSHVICIAGAHRSGTSLLTRLLQHCGLYLGPESEMMPPGEDNPDGFWENLRFVELNDEILNAVGGAWDLPPLADECFEGETLAPASAKAELLLERFRCIPTWGWKDPRNSLTLPFWRGLLPGLKTVVMVRNPLEVAYSMHRRNGTSYALGLRLWEIYNRRVLARTEPSGRLITNYQTFFDNPERELRIITAFAGLEDSGAEIAAKLVSQERRHTSFTIEQMIDAGVSRDIVRLYQDLLQGHGEDHAVAATPQLSGAPNRIVTRIPDGEDIRKELAERRGNDKQQREVIAQHQATIEDLRRELAENNVRAAAEINRRDGRIEELQKAHMRLDALILREQEQRRELHEALQRREQEHRELAAALQRRDQEHSELRRREEKLREQLEQRDREHRDLRRREEELRQQLERRDQEHSEWRRREEELRQQSEQRDRELSHVRDRFNQTNQLLQTLSVRLTDAEARGVSLTDRLRKQLLELKKLLRILDQLSHAATLLRKSRRWKLANPFTALRSVFTGEPLHGFGHLDNNLAKYQAWRQSHPEVDALAEEIQSLRVYADFTGTRAPSSSAETEPKQTAAIAKPPAPTKPLAFESHKEVEVSIVIPVFNQVEFTRSCLASLQEHTGDLSFEVIVVDDCSNDETTKLGEEVPNLVYLRNKSNSGFIESCNRGAAEARGGYLVFLNNDTIVSDGWLDALHETFQYEPAAGLVGSKLIYPDGRLQEAGGIIWRDASGWNRGKFQDASRPEYNYLREVDYCSAASVMIPKELFLSLGGFDPKYKPAYYEDTDLAFKVAQAGSKVLYQPLSVVTHFEGATGGTDIATGTKKYQEVNRATFLSSWAGELAAKPANGDIAVWDKPAPGTARILVVDHHLPLADRDSGSLRMFQILSILCRLGHRVTFLPDNLADIPPYGDRLRIQGVEVIHYPYCTSIADYLETSGKLFDIIVLSRCDFAVKHLANVRHFAPDAFVIFDTVDLHYLREEREAELLQSPELRERAREKRDLEYRLIDEADQTWVVSSAERELLRQVRSDSSIEVVSNIVPVPGSAAAFSARRDILFIGSFQHPPNTDAVIHFAQRILPLIQNRVPRVRFYVIGGNAPPEVVALSTEQVIVAGYQPDVTPSLTRSSSQSHLCAMARA